ERGDPVAQARKGPLLTTLLRREAMRSVLVFVKRKSDADQLARTITRSGVRATSIHSDRRQEDRIAALEAFRRGEYPVLVATDVAARGLDVEGTLHTATCSVTFSSHPYIHPGGPTTPTPRSPSPALPRLPSLTLRAPGFTRPAPDESDSIPPAPAARRVLACAMSGSGKTAAFLPPIMQPFLAKRLGVTRALILTP